MVRYNDHNVSIECLFYSVADRGGNGDNLENVEGMHNNLGEMEFQKGFRKLSRRVV